jgi:hypothetical protein
MQAVFKIKNNEVLGTIYVKYKGGDSMKKKNRREFLGQMIKGAAVGMLSLLPGSLFSGRISFGAVQEKDTLESVLKRVSKRTLYRELNTAKLMPEEKLTIAMVTEIQREDLNEVIADLDIDKGRTSEGSVCGVSCGFNCGSACGLGCGDNCVSSNAFGVVDMKGELRIKLSTINKPRLLSTLKKAQKLIK